MDRRTQFNNENSDETKRIAADKIHGILKTSRRYTNKAPLPDRGDMLKKTARVSHPKRILANVAKTVFQDDKVPTVNRCSSIGDAGDDCVIRTASKKPRQVKQRVVPKPIPCNGLCRDKCRITLQERRRLRQRYTFRLKPHVPVEDEDTVVQEESESAANRLKYFYLPNDKSLDESQKRTPKASSQPKAKTVSFIEHPIRHRTLHAQPERTSFKTKLTPISPIKLRSVHSKVNIKTKRRKPKKKIVNERASSPELATACLSPPTEIARWIPDAGSLHAKPYYDAWVSTTLAAFSQQQNEDLYREKKDIVQRLKKNFDPILNKESLLRNSRCRLHDDERNSESFLTEYPICDEAVVGRIRIKR